MKMSATHRAVTVLALGCLTAGAAMAKVSAEEADKLGKSLTCVGAEKAGSANGVPEYVGKWLGAPPGVNYKNSVGQHPVDVYADEQPKFVITAENMSQYAEHLTDGQKAMFAKYPKTFRMPVYPGHRDFRHADYVCEAAKNNALNATVNANNLSVTAVNGSMPFPIPKTAMELVFNALRPAARATTEHIVRDNVNVLSNGSFVWGRAENRNLSMIDGPANAGKPMEGVMAYTINLVLLPDRDKGGVTVSQEPLDYGANKRLAWSYDPGTRRVRQVPEFGFDQPMGGTGGKLTIDSDRLFNGSPERYEWTMGGKKEIFVPANAYKVHGNNVKYADLLKPGHANPDFLRYELRRVWVLEGKVKDGYRHLYGRRVLFLDEDTMHAVMSDYYDARGKLWQYAFINYYYAFDINAWHAGTSFYHDLDAGSYLAYNLFQERPLGPVLNKMDMKSSDFTPEAARSIGR